MGEQWYWCGIHGFSYPASEAESHKECKKKWPIEAETEESNQDDEK